MNKDSTKKVRTQEVKPRQIGNHETVICIRQGEYFAEVVKMAYKPRPGAIPISKDEYVVLRTGEILPYKHNETKQKGNLIVTFRELRWLIRTNFTEGSNNQLFVTLTYAENMTDEKKLYTDFKDFMKRLAYHHPEHEFEYIVVHEPQERGAWHCHLMLKTDKPSLYIEHKRVSQIWGDENILRKLIIAPDGMTVRRARELGYLSKEAAKRIRFDKAVALAKKLQRATAKLNDNERMDWPEGYRPIKGHGWTTTERLKSDDVGAYYVAYFTDLTTESDNSEELEVSEDMSNARKKGSRLHLYPKGFRFYRCSRGIDRPVMDEVAYGEILKEFGQAKHRMAYEIEKTELNEDGSEDVRLLNNVQRETFKKAKKKSGM